MFSDYKMLASLCAQARYAEGKSNAFRIFALQQGGANLCKRLGLFDERKGFHPIYPMQHLKKKEAVTQVSVFQQKPASGGDDVPAISELSHGEFQSKVVFFVSLLK